MAQWFWRRRLKCDKFTEKRTDGRQVIRKAHLSFQLSWASKKVSVPISMSIYARKRYPRFRRIWSIHVYTYKKLPNIHVTINSNVIRYSEIFTQHLFPFKAHVMSVVYMLKSSVVRRQLLWCPWHYLSVTRLPRGPRGGGGNDSAEKSTAP